MLQSLRELEGDVVHRAVLTAIPGPGGEALRSGQVVPVGWYPVSWYAALHVGLESVTHGGEAMVRKLAHHSIERDFTGLHRLLVRMISPHTAAKNAHRLLQHYWRGGTIAVIADLQDRAVVRYTGWRGFNATIWGDMGFGIEAMLRVVGSKAPRVRVISASASGCDADLEARFA
jgi:hypothetical protein